MTFRGMRHHAKNKEDLLYIKSKLSNTAVSSFTSFKSKARYEKNLPEEELTALNNLIRDNEIVIQRADKGNTVVLTNKDIYVQRIKDIISDRTKFRDLDISTNDVMGCLKYILDSEKRVREVLYRYNVTNKNRVAGIFSEKVYSNIAPTGSRPGILYGLPKVHKPLIDGNPKFRQILSAISTPTYRLSKYLVPLLTPITTNDYTVKDSFSFAKEVINFDSSLHMSSLDIESLFTNIPLEETINICTDSLFIGKDTINNINKETFKLLLQLALSESCFVFDGKLYSQTDGVSMGSPLGPSLANSFLVYHEKQWLDNCPENIKPLVYRRYVDDIFLLCRDAEHHQKFLDYMNTKHVNMKFTEEKEKHNTLSFLDVQVSRDSSSNTFTTNVYRKPTFSGVYTNFTSYIPLSYKTGLLWTLLDRCFNICSSYILFHEEVSKIKKTFLKNHYPISFIDNCINSFLTNKLTQTQPVSKKEELNITLPFLGRLSLQIRKKLRLIASTRLPNCKLRVVYKIQNRLRNKFRFKDLLPEELKSNVLYKYTCSSCNASYEGETSRHCYVRFCEHLGITPIRSRPSRRVVIKSPIHEHIVNTGHVGTLDDFIITGGGSTFTKFQLQVMESLLISKNNPILNKDKASVPLFLF